MATVQIDKSKLVDFKDLKEGDYIRLDPATKTVRWGEASQCDCGEMCGVNEVGIASGRPPRYQMFEGGNLPELYSTESGDGYECEMCMNGGAE